MAINVPVTNDACNEFADIIESLSMIRRILIIDYLNTTARKQMGDISCLNMV